MQADTYFWRAVFKFLDTLQHNFWRLKIKKSCFTLTTFNYFHRKNIAGQILKYAAKINVYLAFDIFHRKLVFILLSSLIV